VGLLGDMPVPEHMPVFVRHHRTLGSAGPDLAPADHEWHIDALGRHLCEAPFELCAFWRAWQVAFVRVVLGWGDACGG
jgi:hypothetical protein